MTFLEDEYSEESYRKTQEEAEELEASESAELFSARARKKKRIYKRKKTEKKPDA